MNAWWLLLIVPASCAVGLVIGVVWIGRAFINEVWK